MRRQASTVMIALMSSEPPNWARHGANDRDVCGTQTCVESKSPVVPWMTEGSARVVGHIDLGTRWIDPAQPDRYHRLSWIPTTGELYLTDSAESYFRVMAVIPDASELAVFLTGVADVAAGQEASLAWVEDRLAQRVETD